MKKVLGIGSCIVGSLLVVFGGLMRMKENTAVSIIGGADGPTSVFVAGKLNGELAIISILIGIMAVAMGVRLYLKRKH